MYVEPTWEKYAELGICAYCRARRLVKPEPFGQVDACQPCWEQIVYGTEDRERMMLRCPKCGGYFPDDELEHHEACCGGGA